MDSIRLRGGRSLRGSVALSGSKNASLPLLCASLLTREGNRYTNLPQLRDVRTLKELLRSLGAALEDAGDGRLSVSHRDQTAIEAPYELVKQMRASILVLGPLAAARGRARVSLPGGCAIGARPIDQHLKGLAAMGAEYRIDGGYVDLRVPSGRLRGAEITFDMPTVTGTENLMSAAALAQGTTVLRNAAKEPEVVELGRALERMGAEVRGVGTDRIEIVGRAELHGAEHEVQADRIEAGTYLVAGAAMGEDVMVRGVDFERVAALVEKLRHAGAEVSAEAEGLRVRKAKRLRATDITTSPYPGFATDLQAQFMVLCALAEGTSRIVETVFENRFMHVAELVRMGADIGVQGREALVRGGRPLKGAEVMATDLRASASLVLAGLIAEGETTIRRVYHLDRGYEAMENKLAQLGADIERVAGKL